MSTINNLPILNTLTNDIRIPIVDTSVVPNATKQMQVGTLGTYINKNILTTYLVTATTATLGGVIVGPTLIIKNGIVDVNTGSGTVLGTKGSTGATGIGATGATGPQGNAGSTGATGPQGATGATGATGPQGATGVQGIPGTAAAQGATGATGIEGRSFPTLTSNDTTTLGLGLKTFTVDYDSTTTLYLPGSFVSVFTAGGGMNGIITAYTGTTITINSIRTIGNGTYTTSYINISGFPGSTGNQGATGAAGSNGTNGTNGATGATGIQGPPGATGPQGTTGATGPTGASGATGSQGATGPAGATGLRGATGAVGATGGNGTNGANGTTGATGPTGATGAVSTLANGTYSVSTLYVNTLTVTGVGAATVQSGNDLRLVASGQITALSPFVLLSVTTANLSSLNSITQAGAIVYVPDASGGAQPCYFDGTHWYTVNGRIQVA